MALDTFSKSGVTTYTFSRGNTYPIEHKYQPNIVKSISGGGASKMIVDGAAQEFWGINLNNISSTDVDLLHTFFNNSLVNWGEQLFTWTDNESTARDVRLWNNDIKIVLTSADLYIITFTLKVEV